MDITIIQLVITNVNSVCDYSHNFYSKIINIVHYEHLFFQHIVFLTIAKTQKIFYNTIVCNCKFMANWELQYGT